MTSWVVHGQQSFCSAVPRMSHGRLMVVLLAPIKPKPTGSSLLTGQVTQIPNVCTNVSFQIISSRSTEELILFADGPCLDAELSKVKVSVNFLPCSCPIGFVPSNAFNGMLCLCACDSQISPYVANGMQQHNADFPKSCERLDFIHQQK